MVYAKLLKGTIVNIAEFEEAPKGWVDITNREVGIGCIYDEEKDDFSFPEEPESLFTTPDPKYTGVEFEGVMCSATSEDMWGLSALRPHILEGMKFDFKFVNGNVLNLNEDNILEFELVWLEYRNSFFGGSND